MDIYYCCKDAVVVMDGHKLRQIEAEKRPRLKKGMILGAEE